MKNVNISLFFSFSIFLFSNIYASELQTIIDLEQTDQFTVTLPNKDTLCLVKRHKSIDSDDYIDRKALLENCTYLTGEALLRDWELYSQGDRSWVDQSRIITLDCETTNSSYEGRIIQLHASEMINGSPTGLVFSAYINPKGQKISKYAQKVHTISNEDLHNSPLFSEVAEHFRRFIGNSLMIAHNASFDVRMISQELEQIPGTDIEMYYKCTRWMSYRDQQRIVKNTAKHSPLKRKRVKHLTEEEIKDRNAKKRRLYNEKKARKKPTEQKNKNSSSKNKSNKLSFSLGAISEKLGLTAYSQIVAVNGLKPLEDAHDLKHHNADYDTQVVNTILIQNSQNRLFDTLNSPCKSQDNNK